MRYMLELTKSTAYNMELTGLAIKRGTISSDKALLVFRLSLPGSSTESDVEIRANITKDNDSIIIPIVTNTKKYSLSEECKNVLRMRTRNLVRQFQEIYGGIYNGPKSLI